MVLFHSKRRVLDSWPCNCNIPNPSLSSPISCLLCSPGIYGILIPKLQLYRGLEGTHLPTVFLTTPPPRTPAGCRTTAWESLPQVSGPARHQCCMFASTPKHRHCWPMDCDHPTPQVPLPLPSIHCYQVLRPPLSPLPRHPSFSLRPFNPVLQTALSGRTMESLLPQGGVLWGVFTSGCRGDPDSVTQHPSHLPADTHTHTHTNTNGLWFPNFAALLGLQVTGDIQGGERRACHIAYVCGCFKSATLCSHLGATWIYPLLCRTI